MNKPTTILDKDGNEVSFKEVCVLFESEYCWYENIKYKLPLEKWKGQSIEPKNIPHDTNYS